MCASKTLDPPSEEREGRVEGTKDGHDRNRLDSEVKEGRRRGDTREGVRYQKRGR